MTKGQGRGLWWKLLVMMTAIAMQITPCFADVITSADGTGPADYIYVAGNPNFYPLEYYNADEQCYQGLMPMLLERVSDDTGLSFAYVNAGTQNTQQELIRNNQVEMATALRTEELSRNAVSKWYAVCTIEIDGAPTVVYIGFTAIADTALRETIVAALERIPEAEKTTAALSLAANPRSASLLSTPLLLALTAAAAVLITLIAAWLVHRDNQKKNHAASMIDSLTGLGNGDYYAHCFRSLISEKVQPLYYVAYLSCVAAKDRLLLPDAAFADLQKCAGQCLCADTASNEYLARVSDGVFVLLYQSANLHEAEVRIEHLMNLLRETLTPISAAYSNAFGAGVCPLAEYPDPTGESAFRNARRACRHAQENGQTYAFSTAELIRSYGDSEKLRKAIDAAIENDEFQIYLQFIVDAKTERICGAEVLSRWDNRELGLILPKKYIGMMERNGTIVKHDFSIFEKLCGILATWQGTAYDGLFLNCNFTRLALSDEGFTQQLRAIADKYSFDHGKLVMEITEDYDAVDTAQMSRNIALCRAMGFQVAIDDMGSGYSSLSDLSENEMDMVKIGRDLTIKGMTEHGFRLLCAVITLAHNMNARVLCEGIETEDQHRMLCSTDCDLIQGYYYSRVLPYQEAMRFLDSQMKSVEE